MDWSNLSIYVFIYHFLKITLDNVWRMDSGAKNLESNWLGDFEASENS